MPLFLQFDVLAVILQRVSWKSPVLGNWMPHHQSDAQDLLQSMSCLFTTSLLEQHRCDQKVIVHQGSVEWYMKYLLCCSLKHAFQKTDPSNQDAPIDVEAHHGPAFQKIKINKETLDQLTLVDISHDTWFATASWEVPCLAAWETVGHPRQVIFSGRNTSSVATKEHGRSTSPKPIPITTSAWCLDLTKAVPVSCKKEARTTILFGLPHRPEQSALLALKVLTKVLTWWLTCPNGSHLPRPPK